MSEFVLQPARLREGKFVPERNADPVELSWAELVQRLAPSKTRAGLLILRNARVGMFIGTRKGVKGGISTFSFDAAGRSRNASQVLKQDPTFPDSVVEIFLVKSADWGMRLQELGAA